VANCGGLPSCDPALIPSQTHWLLVQSRKESKHAARCVAPLNRFRAFGIDALERGHTRRWQRLDSSATRANASQRWPAPALLTSASSLIWALKSDSQIYAFTRILGTSYGIK